MTSLIESITPADLDLPAKFKSFRRVPQLEALDWALDAIDRTPVLAACLQTGSGKTLFGIALARILGVKAVYLVATKALQEQVLNDFRDSGMVSVVGRANYPCPRYGNCDLGNEADCSLGKTVACEYTAAVQKAKASSLVVTNYAYWLHARMNNQHALENEDEFSGDGAGVIGLLICDEAHSIENQLGGFACVKVYRAELGKTKCPKDGKMDEESLAVVWLFWVTETINKLKGSTDDDDKDLVSRCRRILRMNGNWVWQFDDHGHCTFTPVRLAQFTKSLFSGVPRVLLMSASLDPFTCSLLLPKDFSYSYKAWPSVFPPQNAPVYHIPTVKLTWKSTDTDYAEIIEAMDRIIDQRPDRKGVIHTVSYARSKRAIDGSRHRSRFISNDNGSGLRDVLTRFRANSRDGILVSPSVEEGFDFEGDQCEFQIILKFPFPNESNRVIKERCTQIPGYRLHHAAHKIVQMRGRPIRSAVDRAETFILDNSVGQLKGLEGKQFLPPGFRIFTVAKVPPAPPRINQSNQSTDSTVNQSVK